MESKFTIQTPDFYKAIYKSKSYQIETIQLLGQISSQFAPPWDILDVGAGSGQLIKFLYPFSNKYIAIEPSSLMYESLVEYLKINKLNKVSSYNLTFEKYIKNFVESDFNVLIANFNVFNYLKYDEFISSIKKIDSKKESKKIIAFDTWSLDYVLKKPSRMKSTLNFEIIKNDKRYKIKRLSNSNFIRNQNKLNIEFEFLQTCPEKLFLGNEVHSIYPFDINILRYDIEKFASNFSVFPFPSQNAHNQKFDNFRNWLILITLG